MTKMICFSDFLWYDRSDNDDNACLPIYWLIDWLINGWLIEWLLVDWLSCSIDGALIDWYIAWSIDDKLIRYMKDWEDCLLVDWLMIGCLIDDWLIDWLIDYLLMD